MTSFVVRNQTPCRLRLTGNGRVLELAPLQSRRSAFDPVELGEAEQQAVREGVLAYEQEPVREVRERWSARVLLVAGPALLWLGHSAWQGNRDSFLLAFLVLALCGAALSAFNRVERGPDGQWSRRSRGTTVTFNSWDVVRGSLYRLLHGLLLLVVLLVGLALPAVAVWYGTRLSSVVRDLGDDTPLDVVAPELVTRGLQVMLIGLLVLVPALMYFWFDRQKVETLLDRWLHHIFRFDPTLRTLVDVDGKYGRRIEEAYGTTVSGVGLSSSQRGRARSPVVVATLLLALGWVLVLVKMGAPETTVPIEESAASQLRAKAMFDVDPTPVSFAFLGAYVYSLQIVLRGFVRGDLRPKTYNAISVRIIVAFVLAGVLQGLAAAAGGTSESVLVPAFLAGIVPDTILRSIRDFSPRRRGRSGDDELADEWPLTDLVGIDLYERTRLGEEGITNVQALAHHDVVDLTLSTRIPFERVVNWVDQAVLYEHVTAAGRESLRHVGVTTATALLEVHQQQGDELEKAVPKVKVKLVVHALAGAEWLPLLLAWREHDQSTPPTTLEFPAPSRATAHEAPATDQTDEPAGGVVIPEPRAGGQHRTKAQATRKRPARRRRRVAGVGTA